MYKKLLTIILAIAIVATLGVMSVNAASYSFCTHSVDHGGSCDGTCYISNTKDSNDMYEISGSASTWHSYMYCAAEVYSYYYGQWYYDTGYDNSAYVETPRYYSVTNDFSHKNDFDCSHMVYNGK